MTVRRRETFFVVPEILLLGTARVSIAVALQSYLLVR
jgi:hypothetical protein